MGRAACARRERPSRRLSLRPRRPAGTASSPSFLTRVPRLPARLALAALLCLGAASVAAPASADVLVSNVGKSVEEGESFSESDAAQQFTTGSNASGYTLTSIELRLSTGATPTAPTVKVFSGSATGTEVATLSAPASLTPSTEANFTFTASGTVTLSASTDYWVVAEGGNTDWTLTDSGDEDGTPATGWSIHDVSETRDATSTGDFSDDALARLRQLGPLGDDNVLIFRDRAPKGRHYTARTGTPPTRLQDRSFGAGCLGNFRCR